MPHDAYEKKFGSSVWCSLPLKSHCLYQAVNLACNENKPQVVILGIAVYSYFVCVCASALGLLCSTLTTSAAVDRSTANLTLALSHVYS